MKKLYINIRIEKITIFPSIFYYYFFFVHLVLSRKKNSYRILICIILIRKIAESLVISFEDFFEIWQKIQNFFVNGKSQVVRIPFSTF
jgi:hypothetical protein